MSNPPDAAKPARPLVLVVDDEPGLCDVLVFYLQESGYRTLVASGGDEALILMKTNAVDAVVSDIRMPNGSGIDLLDNIKRVSPHKPVVLLLTAFADLTIEEAYKRGADALLSKPVTCAVLIDALARSLTGKKERWTERPERRQVDVRIDVSTGPNETMRGVTVIDIGRGGMFVAMPPDILPKIGAEMSFHLPLPDGSMIDGMGTVRWVRDEVPSDRRQRTGVGIEFTSLSDSCREKIVAMIESDKQRAFIPDSGAVRSLNRGKA